MTTTSTPAPRAQTFKPADWLARFHDAGGGHSINCDGQLYLGWLAKTEAGTEHPRDMVEALSEGERNAIREHLLSVANPIPWERAKALFAAAIDREARAGHAHTELENALVPDGRPERQITYTTKLRRFGELEMERTLRIWDCANPSEEIARHPEFAPYCAEVAAWKERVQALRQSLGADAIEAEWEEAVDDRVAIWMVVATARVETLGQLIEKLELCSKDHSRDGDGCTDLLLDSIAADAKRLAGEA